MATSAERNTIELESAFAQRVGSFGGGAVDATAVIHKGALLAFDTADSKVKPAATSTTLIALGRAEESLTAGQDVSCVVRSGIYGYDNSSAGDAITNADAGAACYVVDDATVAKTDGGATRSEAGKIVSVVGDQVFVAINPLI